VRVVVVREVGVGEGAALIEVALALAVLAGTVAPGVEVRAEPPHPPSAEAATIISASAGRHPLMPTAADANHRPRGPAPTALDGPVHDLSPSELVLAWNERHCPPLLETFVTLCARVVSDAGLAVAVG
jgi:hypothetical protein